MTDCTHPTSTGPTPAMQEDGDLRRRCDVCGQRFTPVRRFSTTTYERDPDGRLDETYTNDAFITPLAGTVYAVEASDDLAASYADNGLRWARVEDAHHYAVRLSLRWFGATHIRIRACDPEGFPTGETIEQILSR